MGESLPGYDSWRTQEPDEYTGLCTYEMEVLVVVQIQATPAQADDHGDRIVAQVAQALSTAPIEGQVTDVTFGAMNDLGPVED